MYLGVLSASEWGHVEIVRFGSQTVRKPHFNFVLYQVYDTPERVIRRRVIVAGVIEHSPLDYYQPQCVNPSDSSCFQPY